ncbi:MULTISPECIES: ATP-binding protein [unclassified Streptomyces]|uniref:ATP-binding protein n=1 Tax=unclassified Streptomyces TaxID=2593676 RepID=UPI0007C4B33A|nr:ATP-binding protein [Streptomyces sp. NRRL F-2747]
MNQPAAADTTRNRVRTGDRGPAHTATPTATPVTAATARSRVSALLQQAGISLDSLTAVDALLVTSELVTNAIRHGGGVTALTVHVADGTLHLSVTDDNPRPPETRNGDPQHPGGYGWPLIQRLAEHVTIRTHATGKTISTTLRLA